MGKEKKILVFIAIGRTGSNYLFKMLNNCSLFFNTYELFKKECIYALSKDLKEYEQYVNIAYGDECNKKLVDDVHLYPEVLINFFKNKIINSTQKEFFTFKLFPGHLEFENVKKVLSRNDIEVVFVKRKPIESYISMLKAKESGKWKNTDHTDIKPELEFNKFVKWYNKNEKWYKDIENLLNESKQKIKTLYYEDFTKSDDNENLKYILETLLQDKNYLNNLEVESTMIKQDKNKNIKDKVSNWDTFYQICEENNWNEKIFSNFS